ncbi:MAG: SLBB domain-containing protein [bacterium]|nr:SLBB domain-containing protein [bacterium]
MGLSKDGLIKIIKEAGVAGAGGAGFPTHVKLDHPAEYFIVNIAECEPLLKVDQQLAFHFAEEIVRVLDLFHDVLAIKKIRIAIKKKYEAAVERFSSLIRDKKHIELFYLEDCYPAGDEQDIVYHVTGRIIPEGGLPLDAGAIVDNVGTVLNIYEALFEDKPVTHRWLTVAGEVRHPQTLNLPVGTLVRDVLRLCGGPLIKEYVLIDGGPMMGKLVSEEDTVNKTTSGLLLLPAGHPMIRRKKQTIEEQIRLSRSVCEQCFMCTESCSRYILGHQDLKPHLMMRRISYLNQYNLGEYTDAFLCSQCGLCSYYACPQLLSPKDVYKFLRDALVRNKVGNPFRGRAVAQTHPMYPYRRIPIDKLKLKLDVKRYDHKAAMNLEKNNIREVKISLKQHAGNAPRPVVKEHQQVREGELIADLAGDSSPGVRLHSSISGTVKQITEDHILIEKVS